MKYKEQENRIADLKKKIDTYKAEIQTDIQKACIVCPERRNTHRSVTNLESEINQINKRIKTVEKSHCNPEEITRRYNETMEAYKKIKEYVNQCRKFIERLEKVMIERQKKYCVFRSLVARRARCFFIVLLSNRQYSGKMTFSHHKETLEISVQPLTEGEINKDMRSLSGGERSFATVCFILALWDSIESPFRCLDEFDVFMDMINRRISMDMMMHVAQSQKHKQFIFLTPQDMSQPGIIYTDLNIIKMPNPDRGQGTLPFESVNRQQEDEDEN